MIDDYIDEKVKSDKQFLDSLLLRLDKKPSDSLEPFRTEIM